jgi:acetyl-CoA/propionyl-CoA carboxylase, biotin carboxylase, biotin carboxyl carrier protein
VLEIVEAIDGTAPPFLCQEIRQQGTGALPPEQCTKLDLVREMFRIAEGEALGYGDPQVRGHAIQFRIYAEDPRRGFTPAPGTVRVWRPPSGPGVRLDPGVRQGSQVAGEFGTLLAKLIVTGASRVEALERARRALGEFEVDAVTTTLPFHRWVVTDEEFAPSDPGRPFSIHTGWIESAYRASYQADD